MEPLKTKATQDNRVRGNLYLMETIVSQIVLPDMVNACRALSTSKLKEFDLIDHLAYSVYRMHDRLDDVGLLHSLRLNAAIPSHNQIRNGTTYDSDRESGVSMLHSPPAPNLRI